MLNKVKHDKRHQRRETYGGGLGLVVVRFKRPTDIMACRGSCSWRSAASTRASIPSKSNSGGCCSQVHAKYMWQRKAKPRVIGQNTGGGLGLVVVRARDQSRGRACRAGGRVRSAPQGQTYCSWRSHITRGAVVRCAMCGVCRCAMCVVCR